MDFNAGSSVGRRWAELLAASGQLHGRHWAGSHGRRHAIVLPVDGYVANAATAVADAAWRAAQVFASVDNRAVAAFKESLQQSCQ